MNATTVEILSHDGSSIRISAREVREIRHYNVEQSEFVTLVLQQRPRMRGLIHEFHFLGQLAHALESSGSAR